MMTVIRQTTELLINPFFICLFLMALCTLFVWRRVYSRFVRTTLLLVVVILVVISTNWLPEHLTYQLESRYPVVTQIDPKVQWIVVLSGGQNTVKEMPANDVLSGVSMKRLVEGVRLFRASPKATLVLSGGGAHKSEAANLAEVAAWFAIPLQRIILEDKSLNTADQAKALRSIVHEQPFYLVTSAVHMQRSMMLCKNEGLNPIAAPTDFTFFLGGESWSKRWIPNAYNMFYVSIALHELLGKAWALAVYSSKK